ncbi:MAG: acetyl-CoA carboxylase biotin carboxyl carrier protein [Phycisphaerales bacterium]|nr:acetyl-CoA carboxylase biotin carboxyl carrier protein [Phycisphaerales bacterium]
MDIRKLKELVKLMVENDLTELDLRDEQETVVVKRGFGAAPVMGAPVAYAMPAAGAAPRAAAAPAGEAAPAADDEAGLVAVTSPMVGTFYSAPDPESPPFVSVGTNVGADTVVCIIEAMKVFSEIKAEHAGTIEKVLVKNGEPVEFGQKLFLVRPS